MKNWITNRYNGVVFGRTVIGEFLNVFYSLRLFLKYRFKTGNFKEKENQKAFLIKQYHIVEKGLALPSPRENFGIPKIKILLTQTLKFEEAYGYDNDISIPVRNVIKEYLKFNPNLTLVDNLLQKSLIDFSENLEIENLIGGTKLLRKEQLINLTNIDYHNFVLSRSSVRDFKVEQVDRKDIRKAIDIAKNAPSVCNRQNWKLHYYDDPDLKTQLLNMQHGNGGFTESIQGVFLVTSNLKGFTKMEQNQVFVDGGLISMNLVLALHHLGIGSCCLNTCFPYTREIKIKTRGNIPENERLIMMIGVGYWKDEFKVAYSKKKDVEDILTIH